MQDGSQEWVYPRETPSPDDRYMGLAFIMSGFSKDPRTQIGAYIVAPDNIPRGGGYNGPPRQINDDQINWSRASGKNDLIIHAEVNAITYANGPVEGCTIYVTGHPCKHCMNYIGYKGIRRVVYLERSYDKGSMQSNQLDLRRSQEIASLHGMIIERYAGNLRWLKKWIALNEDQGIIRM